MRKTKALRLLSGRTFETALGVAAASLLVFSAVASLVIAPPDALQGDVQRLMYVHVPAAWLAYLAFFVVFVASVGYLVKKHLAWDRVAHASAEIGVLFTGLAIALGSLWGKPVWGVWWTWDPRLTTTAILLLVYLGYLAVRRLPDSPSQRARWAAGVGIAGFINVPIVHLSIVWWRSLHQPASVIRFDRAPTMAGEMLAALILAVVAFTFLYFFLLILRLRVARMEERVIEDELLARVRARPRVEMGRAHG